MRKNLKLIAFAIGVCAVSALNVKVMLNAEHADDLAMTTLAAIGEGNPGESGEGGEGGSGEDNPFDWGELDEFTITCNKGGSGKCYQKRVETIGLNKCRVSCKATGDPKDSCSSFWMSFIDYCINN